MGRTSLNPGYAWGFSDVGDTYPRTVVYFPSTGLVRVKRLQTMRVKYIANQEKEYMDNIADKPVSGDVELF